MLAACDARCTLPHDRPASATQLCDAAAAATRIGVRAQQRAWPRACNQQCVTSHVGRKRRSVPRRAALAPRVRKRLQPSGPRRAQQRALPATSPKQQTPVVACGFSAFRAALKVDALCRPRRPKAALCAGSYPQVVHTAPHRRTFREKPQCDSRSAACCQAPSAVELPESRVHCVRLPFHPVLKQLHKQSPARRGHCSHLHLGQHRDSGDITAQMTHHSTWLIIHCAC